MMRMVTVVFLCLLGVGLWSFWSSSERSPSVIPSEDSSSVIPNEDPPSVIPSEDPPFVIPSERSESRDLKALITFPNAQTLQADVADTEPERAAGLSYRPFPQAMVFLFDVPAVPSFWMKEMNFPIDIIWLTKVSDVTFSVAEFSTEIQPEFPAKTLYRPQAPVDAVLEAPSGTVKSQQLTIGDSLDIQFTGR